MTDRECLIIDDVCASLALMTELGRQVSSEAALQVREAVLAYAARRGWSVVPYEQFAAWALRLVNDSAHDWLVLDPLFPVPTPGSRVSRMRLSRVGPARFDGDVLSAQVEKGHSFGLLDDAAASGATLRHVARLVQQSGATVSTIAVCASTRMARSALLESAPAGWCDFIRGDWRIMHLRDGCSHLPYTGRSIDQPPLVTARGDEVRLCVPATAIDRSMWHSLNVVSSIATALKAGRTGVVGKLEEALGRAAAVGDLALLRP